jgi:hypothetical protein
LTYSFSGLDFLMTVTMKSTVIRIVFPCSSERAQCFEAVRHHLQGRRVSQERNQRRSYPEDGGNIFILIVTTQKTRHFFLLLFCTIINNITKMYNILCFIDHATRHEASPHDQLMKITVFWDVMWCSLVETLQCFRGTADYSEEVGIKFIRKVGFSLPKYTAPHLGRQ